MLPRFKTLASEPPCSPAQTPQAGSITPRLSTQSSDQRLQVTLPLFISPAVN